MKQRLVSFLIALTLIASAIAGALSVSVSFVSADTPTTEDVLYWDDFKADVLQKAAQTPNTSTFIAMFNEIESHWNTSTWNVFVIIDPNGNFLMVTYVRQGGDGFYGMRYSGPSYRMLYNTSNYNSTFKLENYFCYYNGSFRLSGNVSTNISAADRGVQLNLGTTTNTAVWFPTPFEFDASGWKCYSLRGITQGNTNGFSMPVNIVAGSAPPAIIEYDIKTFYLGGSQYATVSDQRLLREMNPEEYDYNFSIGAIQGEGDNVQSEFFLFKYGDLIHIQYPGFDYSDFDNLSPLGGIDCVNIDGIVALGYNEIFYSDFEEYIEDDWYVAAQCVNVPYFIEVNSAENDYLDQMQDFVNKLNTFLDQQDNFNNNYVVPDTNLPGYVKNLLGDNALDAHTFEVVSDGSDVGLVIATNDISYSWLPKQFIVMDVNCFFEFSPEGVDTTYNPFLTLNPEYYNQFDAVIILSHDDFLSVKEYTDSLGASHIDPDFLGNVIYFSFEDSSIPLLYHEGSWFGSYLSSQPDYEFGTVSGMTLFTNHYLLHVQNMILADGITSVCDWLDSYGASTGDYQAAVLDGISANAAALNTINGQLSVFFTDTRSFFAKALGYLKGISETLNSISLKIDDISAKMDDPDPESTKHWYLSLWTFIKKFEPSNAQIGQALDQLETNIENVPLLPALTPVPALPTLGG